MANGYEYPTPMHPRHGYALGVVLRDDVTIGRFVQRSLEALAERFEAKGLESLHSMIVNTDDCATGTFFDGEEHHERYLGESVVYRKLEGLAKVHLGGDDRHSVLAFNRMVAANLTAVTALVDRGQTIVYLVPRYHRPDVMKGYGHPSIPRAADFAGCRCEIVTSVDEVRAAFSAGGVALLGICPYYRDLIPEALVEAAAAEARSRGIPVLVDDASGARLRVYAYGQRKAIDLGADVVCTSTDKYGFRGPRAAVMVGRRDLMDRIRTVALMLGTEARPSIVAAICRAIADFTPEAMIAEDREFKAIHAELHAKALGIFGPRLKDRGPNGVSIMPEDFIELVMERAGIRKTDVAPVDVTCAHAALALRHHGYLLLAAFSYPGGSREVWLQLRHKRSRTLSIDTLLSELDDAIDATAPLVSSRAEIERLLLGRGGAGHPSG